MQAYLYLYLYRIDWSMHRNTVWWQSSWSLETQQSTTVFSTLDWKYFLRNPLQLHWNFLQTMPICNKKAPSALSKKFASKTPQKLTVKERRESLSDSDDSLLSSKTLQLGRELGQQQQERPHPKRGGAQGYPVWRRREILEQHDAGLPVSVSRATLFRPRFV